MNKTTTLLLIIIACLSFLLGSTLQSKAQNKNFAGVIPFMTGGDRLGFFDQSNGKIYLYDNNFTQCLFSGQIQALGEAILPAGKS